jgi:hypothetical protein
MNRTKPSHKKESGQAIIEFILVISILLTMVFVFVQLSWAVAWGHYVHYATFMSARAYYSGGLTPGDQSTNASAVLASYLNTASGQDLFPFIAKARTGDDRDIKGGAEPIPGAFIGRHPFATDSPNNRAFAWAEGVQYNFAVPLYLLPLAGWVKTEGQGQTITGGTQANPTKGVEWKGSIPFTSDSFLGRENSHSECLDVMLDLSQSSGISRGDGQTFIEDNGC